jgi:hypothetical protein
MLMKFNPKALLVLIGFAAVVLLAVSAKEGTIPAALAFAGVIAILLVELLATPLSSGLVERPIGGTGLWRRLRSPKKSN